MKTASAVIESYVRDVAGYLLAAWWRRRNPALGRGLGCESLVVGEVGLPNSDREHERDRLTRRDPVADTGRMGSP